MTSMVDPKRARILSEHPFQAGPVVYWMSRDQRVNDNWALLYAQELATRRAAPLAAVFCLAPRFLESGSRQYNFMLAGLKEVEQSLSRLGIAFRLLYGDPGVEITQFLEDCGAGALVSDFSPLRISRGWKNAVAAQITIPFHEVDAHNVIPCWHASVKQEWAAYTFRPKVHRLLGEFLIDFPPLKRQKIRWPGEMENDWKRAEASIEAESVADANWLVPGEAAARAVLDEFLSRKLSGYDEYRNDPTKDGQSNLSPYLHLGQISAQRAALQALSGPTDASAFLEELVVRRELADNFCCYNPEYDSVNSFPDWAKETLRVHQNDRREYIYSLKELERAETHDDLWNASQKEMLCRGKMHGYLRMYWAKKILEWSESTADALHAAIYLNDRYELDGRDPNGFTGIAWSIGGLHDRAWKEREVFGKVRYMSYNGLRSKFNVPAYIKKVEALFW
ncbi:MAG TPA: deoxyribodipyrimidine photo-lyase [Methanothrix sp.]|nr:deoxyribodipyrimidine photo-lyase [Methanothrix sp.]